MNEYVDDFIDFLSIEKGLAENTLLAYRRDLTKYVRYLDEMGFKQIQQIKRDHISKFLFALS